MRRVCQIFPAAEAEMGGALGGSAHLQALLSTGVETPGKAHKAKRNLFLADGDAIAITPASLFASQQALRPWQAQASVPAG